MTINIDQLIEASIPTIKGFDKIEPRIWTNDTTFLELVTEIGSLGRMLTIWEKYRHGQKSRHKLVDELSDILFVLIRFCYINELDFPETVNIVSTESFDPLTRFFSLIEQSEKIRRLADQDEPGPEPEIRASISSITETLFGFANFYQVDLIQGHLEEMISAQTWQNLFFLKTKKLPLIIKKIIWLRHTKIHEQLLEQLPFNKNQTA